MPTFLNAIICGIVGAVAAQLTYVQSNLFILGDVTRRGRHPLWDPAFFAGVGLLWGLFVGGVCAARFFAASPGKAMLVGLGVTLAGIGVVGGATTVSRHMALPHEPLIAGAPVELEVEVRLPVSRAGAGEWPARGRFDAGGRSPTNLALPRQSMRVSEGRTIFSGTLPLREASSPRLLSFEDASDVWANFLLPLAATPTEADTAWTDWAAAVNSESGLPSTEVFQIRYRVRFGPGK